MSFEEDPFDLFIALDKTGKRYALLPPSEVTIVRNQGTGEVIAYVWEPVRPEGESTGP